MDEVKKKVIFFFSTYGKSTISAFSLLIICISVAWTATIASPKKLRVSFLDIGQGDAILIQTPSGHDMLIDGGPSDLVLERMSEEMNYFDRRLEVMIATHGDADHVTGLIPILKKYDTDIIVRSPIDGESQLFKDLEIHIEEENAIEHVGKRGDVIDFGDGVLAFVLYPNKTISSKTDTNDASVSIVLLYGDHSFLLTGDLGMKYEPQLMNKHLPKGVTVYKAGHHGSKTSSGEQLLTYIKPEYSVISAGEGNRYGHPNPEALARLTNYSKEILSTIDRGTITFISDGRLIEIETEK